MAEFNKEEIEARFKAAEQYLDQLQEALVAQCPAEIVDKFRIGEDNELFRTLLIKPDMELEEGIWSVQTDVSVDLELGIQPHELVLETGPLPEGHGRWRIRLRTKSPSVDELFEPDGHYLPEPHSWEDIEAWARMLRELNVVDGWDNG